MQYSRLFYNQVFPDLHKTLYLDTDTLVLGDVAELYREIPTFSSDRLLAAVPHMIPAFYVLQQSLPHQIGNTVVGDHLQ